MNILSLLRLWQALFDQGETLNTTGDEVVITKTAVTLPAVTATSISLTADDLTISSGTTQAVTLKIGRVVTAALTTAAGATATFTLTKSGWLSASTDIFCTIGNGTNSAGTPVLATATRTDADTLTVAIKNDHASAALNGTLVINFWVNG
jgi:hypothetical protein